MEKRLVVPNGMKFTKDQREYGFVSAVAMEYRVNKLCLRNAVSYVMRDQDKRDEDRDKECECILIFKFWRYLGAA